MTPENVTALLDHLAAAYPTAKGEPDTALIWLQHLNELPVADARDAAYRWIEREKWMPRIAEFVAECRDVARERYQADLAARALPPAPPVAQSDAKANLQQLIAVTRSMLAKQAGNKHQHSGPNPCPVCGGMKEPDVTSSPVLTNGATA